MPQAVVLIAPVGSGKTTLLETLTKNERLSVISEDDFSPKRDSMKKFAVAVARRTNDWHPVASVMRNGFAETMALTEKWWGVNQFLLLTHHPVYATGLGDIIGAVVLPMSELRLRQTRMTVERATAAMRNYTGIIRWLRRRQEIPRYPDLLTPVSAWLENNTSPLQKTERTTTQ